MASSRTTPHTGPTTVGSLADLDLVILCGNLSSEPTVRDLPSGDRMYCYEVTVREKERPASSVPVVLFAATAPTLAAGARVAVVGRVRRRFFRAGGSTASRTEVVADEVVALRRRRDTERVMRRASLRLDASTEPAGEQ
jgi:single-strand DNA-binding protein